MKIEKCIVIGANGYIGKHLTAYLCEKNVKVFAFDNLIQADSETDYMPLDILDNEQLKQIDWNVDAVFHFAGLTGTFNGFDNYFNYFNVNELGFANVLNAIRNSGFRPRLVYPSTRLVYKGSDLELSENSEKEARTIYAANKITCENLLETYRNSFDIQYSIFRICVPYGNSFGNAYSYGTIGFFINQAKEHGFIKLYGDGSLKRTFTHVQDISTQMVEAACLDESANEVFNIAGETFSLREVAEKIAAKYKSEIKFEVWPEKDLKIESGHTVFNSVKIEKIVKQAVKNKLRQWIKDLK